MALTREDIGRLTIAEVEAITERATAALSAFREAQAMLGGVAAAPPPQPAPPQVQTPPARPSRLLTEEQQAYLAEMKHQKAKLMEQFKQPEETS